MWGVSFVTLLGVLTNLIRMLQFYRTVFVRSTTLSTILLLPSVL